MKQRIAELPAVDRHPTISVLFRTIGKYHPKRVLEAGCGYGRLMKGLAAKRPNFVLEGCDLADELLADAEKDGLHVFKLDIVKPSEKWLAENAEHWDVVYCRAVFMFLIDHPDDTRKAMQTLEQLAAKKVIIWEWRHVCDYMRSVYPSAKFEYHPTPVWAG
jgi:trans-aconitate methyltransferase